MAYSAAWSEATPLGSLSASDIDQAIRDLKRDIRERIGGLFGQANWTADPLVFGTLNFPNNQSMIAGRNAAGTADIIVAKVSATDQVELGGGAMIVDPVTLTVTFGKHIRFAGNVRAIYWRNNADTQDLAFISCDTTDTLLIGTGTSPGISLASNFGKLGFFQNYGAVKQTVTGAKGGNAALTSLMAALGAAGYDLVTDTTT